MQRRTKYGIYLLVFLIVALSIYGLFHQFYGSAKTLTPADAHLTAPGLIASFHQNEGLADSLYLYKVISITGVLRELVDNGHGDYILRLAGDGDDGSVVDCHLDSLYNHDELPLHPGDRITIRGTCAGRWLNITLVQCIIEKQ